VAEVRRDETLGGFWYAKDDKSLYGYYRELHDDADQTDARFALNKTATILESKHHLLFGWQRHQLDFDFRGPQNAAGFLIDIDNPDFSGIDFSALQLRPRTSREKQTEEGFFVFDRFQLGKNWNFLAGVRHTDLSIKSGSGPTLTPVADLQHDIVNLAGLYKFSENHSVYLSRSESFLPNCGQDRFGGFLPPMESRQYEVGLHVGDENYVHLAVFDIAQSNLTAPDPLDKAAQVAIGSIRSQGVEFSFRRSFSNAWKLSGQAVMQDVRNEEKTKPNYGDRIASVPEHYGTLTITGKSNVLEGWGSLVWVGSRWGDAYNTFKAPGYARLDLGVRRPLGVKTDLQLNIRNLADKRYVEYVSDASNVFQGDRRNIAVSVVHQF
jgi:iron complex outermembrane receptor protein